MLISQHKGGQARVFVLRFVLGMFTTQTVADAGLLCPCSKLEKGNVTMLSPHQAQANTPLPLHFVSLSRFN